MPATKVKEPIKEPEPNQDERTTVDQAQNEEQILACSETNPEQEKQNFWFPNKRAERDSRRSESTAELIKEKDDAQLPEALAYSSYAKETKRMDIVMDHVLEYLSEDMGVQTQKDRIP